METTYYKQGLWRGVTDLPLSDELLLRIRTSKASNGELATVANGVHLEKGFESYRMGKDFCKTLVSEKVQVREKAVRKQHAEQLGQIDELITTVKKFYGI